jgi:predicted DNA-binding transcriptional regulator AlpA
MQTRSAAETVGVPSTSHSKDEIQCSRWINEPLPDLRAVLTSHDICRLTRRPLWYLYGLLLLRRFPRRRTYHDKPVGWHRDDVIAWLTKDLTAGLRQHPLPRACPNKRLRHQRLPLSPRLPRTASDMRSRRPRHKTLPRNT